MSRYELADGTYSDQYVVGDQFKVVNSEGNSAIRTGDIVTLVEDDNTSCPFFNGNDAIYWYRLAKYTPQPTDDTHECDSELEEAYAHIESLESALEDAVRELISLREGNNAAVIDVDNSEFKAISEYTLEDWEAAKELGWVFELNNGEKVFVQGITEEFDSEDFPVELSSVGEGTHAGIVTVDGCFFPDRPAHFNSVKQRIS